MALPSRNIAQMVVAESSDSSQIPGADLDRSKSINSQVDTAQSRQSLRSHAHEASASSPPSRWRNFKSFVLEPTTRKLAACCWQAAAGGWNDACAGALLPYMEKYFNVNYIQVSTLFIGAFAGFFIAGIINNFAADRFGMGKVVTFGAFLQCLGYAALMAPPPFALFPVIYALLIGFGLALMMAQTSAYVASLPNASYKLNYTQAAYGVGALLSPLAATALASSGVRFSYFFGVSLAIACVNCAVQYFTFWRDPEHGPQIQKPTARQDLPPTVTTDGDTIELQEYTVGLPSTTASSSVSLVDRAARQDDIVYSTADKNRAMLRSPVVWAVALFLFFYVGAEVSIGGWAVSFLLNSRGGSSEVGYVSTGFWAGITIGRLVLPRIQARIGDRRCLYAYITLSIALEFAIWFSKALIGNAVSICLVGFLMATFFGIGITALIKLLPKHLHTGAIGLIAAAGQAGSAAFPFLTGALAQKFGPIVLQPVIIALLVGMAIVFAFVPEADRKQG